MVLSAVAAVSAVVSVPAATQELSGSCRVDGFRGNAKMVYEQDGAVVRPVRVFAGAGPHLGEVEPLSASARLQITHLPAGSVTETVDFDKIRPGLTTGVTVSEPVDGVEVPVTARTRLKATFTFVKPDGVKATCRVVKDV